LRLCCFLSASCVVRLTDACFFVAGLQVCKQLDIRPIDAVVGRFADGECKIEVDQNIRGKDVYIIQSCIAPVNDSAMELLLLVSCAKRSGAKRVNAVVPYFGYKHHRRGSPISTGLSSRFLWSAAADFAKMLEVVGADRVISGKCPEILDCQNNNNSSLNAFLLHSGPAAPRTRPRSVLLPVRRASRDDHHRGPARGALLQSAHIQRANRRDFAQPRVHQEGPKVPEDSPANLRAPRRRCHARCVCAGRLRERLARPQALQPVRRRTLQTPACFSRGAR
jgi:hypothetical protein